MAEQEVRRARLIEALTRCLGDPVLSRGAASVERRTWLRRQAAHLERLGAYAVLPGDDDFPRLLTGISDEPTHLFVKGRLPPEGAFTIAMVGTRLPSPSGRRFAEEASSLLVRKSATVVSGLARGLDALSHAAALEAWSAPPAGAQVVGALPGGEGDEPATGPVETRRVGVVPTVAVLACGLDLCYPPENIRLMERIGTAGALVTEFPPGARPLKHHFIRRNRLLSGLSRLVVVVEARRKSGALVTAQYAADQGRDVAAVPGDVWNPASEGPNRLILDGATPVVSLDALIRHCESLGLPRPRGRRSLPANLELELSGLADDLSQVMTRLGHRPRSADQVASELGWAAARVWAALLELELRVWVRRHPAGYIRLK
jgi:DNA processing protein